MDLDVDNYSLDDLLRLFKLRSNFTTEELKAAKRIVLAVHPDKSQLDKKYFIFYAQAYKMLCQVHQMMNRSDTFDVDADEQKKALATDFTKQSDFRDKFNTLFEQSYVRSAEEEEGFGQWMKSAEDLGSSFESRKRESRALAVAQTEPYSKSSLSVGNLGAERDYASLKNVYTSGSVVGVSEEDFVARPRTAEDLKKQREVRVDPLSGAAAERVFEQKGEEESQNNTRRAFMLVQEYERGKSQTEAFWSHLLRLT